jgi:hypothetical protein
MLLLRITALRIVVASNIYGRMSKDRDAVFIDSFGVGYSSPERSSDGGLLTLDLHVVTL